MLSLCLFACLFVCLDSIHRYVIVYVHKSWTSQVFLVHELYEVLTLHGDNCINLRMYVHENFSPREKGMEMVV